VQVGASWEARDGSRLEVRAVGATRTVGGQRFRNVTFGADLGFWDQNFGHLVFNVDGL
jgi:hypothetical protein